MNRRARTTSRRVDAGTDIPTRGWWQTRVGYPRVGEPFQPTDRHDIARSLRTMIRLISVALIVLVAVFAAAIGGYPIPGWATPVLCAGAVLASLALTPASGPLLLAMALTSVRRRWADKWLDADLPLTRLWTVLASPVGPDLFAAYAQHLANDPSARIDGGVDPRIIWALHERGVTPEELSDYLTVGVFAEHAVWLADAGIGASDWAMVVAAGITTPVADHTKSYVPFWDALRFVDWVRSSRASLRPADFDAATYGQRRSVAEALPHMEAWMTSARAPSVRLSLDDRSPCRSWVVGIITTHPLPCAGCGGTQATGHRAWFVNALVGPKGTPRVAVSEWVRATGSLAPYFIAAGIGLDEARQMIADGAVPTVEELTVLGALLEG